MKSCELIHAPKMTVDRRDCPSRSLAHKNRLPGVLLAAGLMLAGATTTAQAATCPPAGDPGAGSLISTFHQSVALQSDGKWVGWGEAMKDGLPAASPIALQSGGGSFAGLPNVLMATTGGMSTNQQTVALTDTGLWAWGIQGSVLRAAHTPAPGTAAQAASFTGSSNGLPTGIAPTDVRQIFSSKGFFALVTNAGQVWSTTNGLGGDYKSNPSLSAVGWYRAQMGSGSAPALTNVTMLRAQTNTSSAGAVMALTSDNEVYTWGPSTYLGDGTAMTARSYATKMTLPHDTDSSLGKVKMIGVTGIGHISGSPPPVGSTYFVLYEGGQLFGMGHNDDRQVGDRSTTERRSWVRVLGQNGQPIENVDFISVQEHNGASSEMASALLITKDGRLFTWGQNDFDMLDRAGYPAANPSFCAANGSCDPGEAFHLAGRGHKARTAEMGGHVMFYQPRGQAKLCYSGHKTGGSMADGDSSSTGPYAVYGCDTADVPLCTAKLPIVATNDPLGLVNGASGNPNVGNAYANDTLNGIAVNPADINGSVTSPATPIGSNPNVPVLDPATGQVSVPPGTPAGTYTIGYQICEKLNPTNCATATVTVTVTAAPIAATDDPMDPVNGASGNPNLGNAYANDTLNGAPVNVADINGSVTSPATPIGSNPNVPVLDPATGQVSVPPGTPAGTYTIGYQICEKLNPTNCATATVTVTVTAAPIVATNDAFGPINGDSGNPSLGNAYTNDTLNGAPVNPADINGTVTSPATPIDGKPVPVLNPATGVVSVPPGTPAGTYTIGYEICEKLNLTNCAKATITVHVVLAAPVPTLNEWAMMLMMSLLAGLGLSRLNRR